MSPYVEGADNTRVRWEMPVFFCKYTLNRVICGSMAGKRRENAGLGRYFRWENYLLMTSSAMPSGTWLYLANSMEKVARPWVAERISVA